MTKKEKEVAAEAAAAREKMLASLSTDLERALYIALEEAKDHLEYCGYGDAWERSCALEGEDRLDKKIENALEMAWKKEIA